MAKSLYTSPYPVTGLGLISGLGPNINTTREKLFFDQQSSPEVNTEKELKITVQDQSDWDQFTLDPKDPRAIKLALAAITEALLMAKIDLATLQKSRVGICLGSTVGCIHYDQTFIEDYADQKFPPANILMKHLTSNISLFVKRYFKLKGPTLMISNACTSGADAIGTATHWLASDLCDLVICGGVETVIPQIYYGFKSMQLYSPRLCQPFDRKRQGLTLGEGAGIFILEKPGSTRTAVSRVSAFASASDSFHPTAPHPEGRGLQQAYDTILKLKRPAVDFINAHGTATAHNDLAEGKWITKNLPGIPVVATKGYTGHTLAAAGAIEAVITVLSLQEQRLPISRGFNEMDPEINICPTQKIESGSYQSALSISLGFGGTNSILCMERA